MTVANRSARHSHLESPSALACPQGAASVAGARPGANPGHFGGIAILPLFLDEPEASVRRQRAAVRARRMG